MERHLRWKIWTNTLVYVPELTCLANRESVPTLVSHCHKEDKSLKTRHSCACAVQRPFKPELTSSNSWKTHMVFLRTWYIILFTVNTRESIVPHERFETHWRSKTMEKRKLQETKTKTTQVTFLPVVRQSWNSQHRETLKLWHVWFAGHEIWKVVNCFLFSSSSMSSF